jgi:hypothetical protein
MIRPANHCSASQRTGVAWATPKTTVLSLLLVVILLPAVSAAATTSPFPSMSRAVTTGARVRLTSLVSSGTFVVTPGITDPICNHGAGAQFSVPSPASSVAAVVLPTGTTLVAASTGAIVPGNNASTVIHALTESCTPDPAFGINGVERLTLGNPGHPQQFTVDAMTPAVGGGVIVAGQSANRWLVGRLGPNGQLDSRFGSDGWALLPWPGVASAVAEAPSGRIVVGGNTTTAGCCRSSVSELSGQGVLEKSFGSGGLTPVASIHDGGLTRVAVGHSGEVLAVTWGGNFGCWTTLVTALTALGHPVQSFEQHFTQGLKSAVPSRTLPTGVFDADLVVQPSGFALVGTYQRDCIGNTPDPTAAGRIVSFGPDGQLNATFANKGIAAFASPMMGSVWALPATNGGSLMVGAKPYFQAKATERAELNIIAFSSDGKIDAAYGEDGHAQVQLPYGNESPGLSATFAVAGTGKTFVIVASSANATALELVRLRE